MAKKLHIITPKEYQIRATRAYTNNIAGECVACNAIIECSAKRSEGNLCPECGGGPIKWMGYMHDRKEPITNRNGGSYMTIHEKQRFVTNELTALLKRIDPDIRGAVYTESNTAAHVVVSYRDKPARAIEVTGCDFRAITIKLFERI